jgi:hypothetical protein
MNSEKVKFHDFLECKNGKKWGGGKLNEIGLVVN